MKKPLFNRITSSIKAGWAMPTLPPHVVSFDRRYSVRFFKFIGSLCIFFIVSGIGHNYNSLIYYSAICWSFLYILYRFVLVFYTIKQWFTYLINGDFIVRNSPFELLGTILKTSMQGIKGGTSFVVGTGFTYALCHELDDILVTDGKQPYFVPGIKRQLDNYGLTESIKRMSDRLGVKDAALPVDPLDALTDTEKAEFESTTGVPFSVARKTFDYFKAKNAGSTVSGEVSKFIENNDPFKTK